MKRITMLLSLSCLILLSAIAATSTSIQTFAHTSNYNKGYTQGQTQAKTDYYAYANDYRPFCPVYDKWTAANGPHSSNFCTGFIDGYNAQWNALASEHNARVQQLTSQDSSVNIKGDNNRVTVNQQVNNNVGDQNSDGSSDSSDSSRGHSSYQPSCKILCSIIRVK